jgi:predicted HicB family RNase H-like nuclease
MNIPAIPDLLTTATSDSGSISDQISIESQLKLRSLYEYLDFCRQTLDEIRQDISLPHIQRVSEKLERFCVEADSWGFDSLY